MEYAWIQEEKTLLLIVVESQHDSEITPTKILWDRRVKINNETMNTVFVSQLQNMDDLEWN